MLLYPKKNQHSIWIKPEKLEGTNNFLLGQMGRLPTMSTTWSIDPSHGPDCLDYAELTPVLNLDTKTDAKANMLDS